MSWNESGEVEAQEPKEEVKEPAVEEKPVEEPKVEAAEVPSEKEPEAAKVVEGPKEELVPQRLIGKIAKSIREKSRSQVDEAQRRVAELEEENRRLKEQPVDYQTDDREAEIRKAAREEAQKEYLERQDALGKQKYGQDYQDALLLLQSQNDPLLMRKIMGAASPADEVMKEAVRIAEDLQYGSDPAERERKKTQALKEKFRKEWEAEMAEKFKAQGNQPTDVRGIRAAGGDAKPDFVPGSWSNTLPK